MRLCLILALLLHSHMRYRFGNVTNGSKLIRNEFYEYFNKETIVTPRRWLDQVRKSFIIL